MPVKKIQKNYRVITGYVSSKKANGMSFFSGSLERDLYTLLDFDWNVARFEEQPVTIPYLDAQRMERSYTPDVLIRYQDGEAFPPAEGLKTVLAEVKFRQDLKTNWLEYKPKFRAARRYAKQRGWVFRLLTEREIRTPFLINAKFLRRFRDIQVDQNIYDRIIDQLQELRETDPESLLIALSDDKWERARMIPHLWYLVARKRVGSDFMEPLNMRSRIWSID